MREASYVILRSLVPAWIMLNGATDAHGAVEKLLYSFCSKQNCTDGQLPEGIINVNGTLYGITNVGGAHGGGTVFSIDPKTDTETQLYPFCTRQGCSDGAGPTGNLIEIGNKLYGTTDGGGAYAMGTVYTLNLKTGAEKVLYSFKGGNDGSKPVGGLTKVKGNLFGITEYGGGTGCRNSYGCGTVFSLNLQSGAENVLHAFQDNGVDGTYPLAGLINVNGSLYGTTTQGGSSTYCGTIYSVDPATGAEKALYSFQQSASDGCGPQATLQNVNGTLYGTTYVGGYLGNDCTTGCGVIFSYKIATRKEVVSYFFCPGQGNCPDGDRPLAGVIYKDGRLYGTTLGGGSNNGGNGDFGVVFSFSPNSGTESVLYSFPNYSTDGYGPVSSPVSIGKSFVGTTLGGGSGTGYQGGCDDPPETTCGTVFEITP